MSTEMRCAQGEEFVVVWDGSLGSLENRFGSPPNVTLPRCRPISTFQDRLARWREERMRQTMRPALEQER